jgi:hypothetical protein
MPPPSFSRGQRDGDRSKPSWIANEKNDGDERTVRLDGKGRQLQEKRIVFSTQVIKDRAMIRFRETDRILPLQRSTSVTVSLPKTPLAPVSTISRRLGFDVREAGNHLC